MRATLSVKSLRGALSRVGRFAERRTTIPILSMFHFEVVDNQLGVAATDFDVEARMRVPVMGAENGSICVPASLLRLVRTLPNWDTISLWTTPELQLVVDLPDGRVSMIGVDPSDFPWIVPKGEFGYWTLPVTELLDAFARVRPFISEEETRYYLNGVFLKSEGERVNFAATNGHTLGSFLIEAPSAAPIAGMIIPRQAVSRLSKALPRGGDVKLGYSASHVTFDADAIRIVSRLIGGKFPDFARVIPTNPTEFLTIPRAPWLGKFSRIAGIPRIQRAAQVHTRGSAISVSMQSHDFGEMIIALPGQRRHDLGDDFAFGCDARLMIDCLLVCRTDEIELAFTAEGAPIRLADKAGMLAVIMPLRAASKPTIELPEGAAA
jgi:DNA polymerase-3 subunit beta